MSPIDSAGPSRLGAAVGASMRTARSGRTAARVPKLHATSARSGQRQHHHHHHQQHRTLSTTSTTSAAAVGAEPAAAMAQAYPGAAGAFGHLAARLSATQPCFGVKGDNVEILSSPTIFHDTLLDMVKSAQRRILISSLYIGTEEESLVRSCCQ